MALRWLVGFHRWSGVALCLFFAVWFGSGMVMLFVPFPSLDEAARLARAEAVDLSQVRVDPGTALALAGGGSALRLISGDGVLRYVAQGERVIDARTGHLAEPLGATAAGRIAARFSNMAVCRVSGPFAYDQWSVHHKFDPWRPLFRVELADAAHTHLYVSARTGEVVQRTQRWERGWNWLGAIPHWLYFTVLRKHQGVWDATLWWLSLFALAGAVSGAGLGLYRSAMHWRAKRRGVSPFKGWWRWHHVLGLAAGLFVLMWVFSGWLSMDHGRLFSTGKPAAASVLRYEGGSLHHALQGVSHAALAPLQGATELAFSVVGGDLVVAGHGTGVMLIGEAVSSQPAATLPAERITAAVRRAWRQARLLRSTDQNDGLYRAADAIAHDALRFTVPGPRPLDLYIDRRSGRLLLQSDRSRKAYAWSYFALHTAHLPGLDGRPRLRLGLQLALLALGGLFSLTGMVLGIKRLAWHGRRSQLRLHGHQ